MKKIITTLILIFSVVANILGQNSEPTISTVDGKQVVCIDRANFDLEIKINVPANYASKIDSFEIIWSYGGSSSSKVLQASNNPSNQKLEFRFGNFYKSCSISVEGTVRLNTYVSGLEEPLNNAFFPKFTNPPTAKITDDSLATCVGKPFTFYGTQSCPTNITTYEWTIDGTPYTGSSATHTFQSPGKKKVRLKVTNPCGTATDEIEINVRELPIAVAEADAKIVANKYVICLNDNEKGKIVVDGSNSKNANSLEWSVIGASTSNYQISKHIPNPLLPLIEDPKKKDIKFNLKGIYTVVLKANMPCNYPDYDTIQVEVIDRVPVTLTPINDTCGPIMYSPPSNIIGTEYFINGNKVSNFPVQLKADSYKIEAKYKNDCGDTDAKIEFKVFEPVAAKITKPTNGTVVCKDNNEKIELEGSHPAGIFSGASVHKSGNNYHFVPAQTGIFTIRYTTGAGQCLRSDSIRIEVIDNIPLTITPQPDACNSLNYTPGNYNSNAQYSINGTTEKNFPKTLSPGTYIIEGILSNTCGSNQTVRDTFNVTTPQNVQMVSPLNDTTVCMSNTRFELAGSHPDGEFSGSSLITKENGKWYFTPSQTGTYIVTFSEGIANCRTTATVRITVIGQNPLSLHPQPDVCNQLSYTPSPLQNFATYKINGTEYSQFPVTLNKEDRYIVEAKFANACGEEVILDTFYVTVPQDVKFTSHSKSTTICKAQGRQEITVSVQGGTFSGTNGFLTENAKYYFNPDISGTGTFNLIYEQGIGSCVRKDTLKITVIESIPLQLPKQEDVCNSFSYTPKGFNDKAIYKLNGQVIANSDFPYLISVPQEYIVQAEMTNECGTLTIADTFELFTPMNVKITSHPQDITICTSNNKLKVKGSTSKGNFVPRNYLTILHTDEAELDISAAGKYEIIFEQGFGSCYSSDTLIVTVENTKILNLDPQENACEPLQYTPQPLNAFAEYTINGVVTSSFPVTLNKGSYIIKATLTDVCETKILTDTFEVYSSNDLKIQTSSNNKVCVNSPSILLKSSVAGAVFTGDHLKEINGSVYFEPILAGKYTITLALPLENCTLQDQWDIEVVGLSPKIEGMYVCQEMKEIQLTGTPNGGSWSSVACNSCIAGQKFIFDNNRSEYDYIYTLTNNIGCTAQDTARIYILKPVSDFELNTPPCSSGIDFDLSQSSGEEYLWKIDGTNVNPPPFTGLSTGKHVITMIARTGHCFDTSSVEVFIIDPVQNAADFDLPHDEHCSPYNLVPNVLSQYHDYLDYKWVIEYDNVITEFTSYNIAGGFNLVNNSPFRKLARVTFNAGNVCGNVSVTDSVEIIGIPQAIIGIDSSRFGCSPYTIAISNIAQGEMDNCIWKIDGKVIQSCTPYIYHTFIAKDSVTKFPIELEVSNECGRHITYDTVTVSPPWIDVFFNTDEYEVCTNTPVSFEDATTPSPIYWKWYFGNGQFSDEQNPSVAFSQPGTYNVTLKASTGCGYDSITRPIIVKDVPTVDFLLPIYACQNQTSDTIINLSEYQTHQFVWDFGNGIRDSLNANPAPVFDDFGDHQVTLTITDKHTGCSNSLSKSYEIKAQPQINILLDSIICYGKELQIPNNTLYANDYTWYYDRVAVHKGKDPLIIFNETGEHYIQLVATYNDNCVDSISKIVFVRRCDVYIPNVFTPNNDGKDDFFTAFGGVNTSMIRSMKLFDRWGETVFSKDNFPLNVEYFGWDGSINTRSKSHGLNSAVFIYLIEIEFTDGTREFFKGDVTLLR